jgi:proton-dependent oligopeptide transporter, POT family
MSDPASPSTMSSTEGHPKGLYLLFGVEMWERFSYYGMRAILVLFLVSTAGGFGWSKEDASQLYGWYTGLVYLAPLIGGYLADRFLGTHRSLLIGGAVIAAGHFCLAFPSRATFFIGLGLIIIGTGLFKPNVSTMVGQLYAPGDRRRDAGFTIFYMGINLGAFLGQIVCGGFADSPRFGWHWGFGAAGVGMVLGLIMYVAFRPKYLAGIGDKPNAEAAGRTATPSAPLQIEERHRVYALFSLYFFSIFFWMAFEQAGSSMNFFAQERTQRFIGGFEVPAPFFQSINPLVIILFAPLFANLWTWLGRRRIEPSTPVKMGLGLLLLGAGFVFMVIGARLSDGGVKVSPVWLVLAYTLHTFGELCVSPVGLSMVTKLAPAKFASLLMGGWFLSSFFANVAGGFVAGTIERVERGEIFRLLGGQADFFLIFVASSAVAGTLLLLLSPVIKRLMHGRG